MDYGLESTLQRQATTALAGAALVNGTETITEWTAPDDGQAHRVMVMATIDVTQATTGGLITVTYTAPDGTAGTHTLFPAGQTAEVTGGNLINPVIAPGSTVTVAQASAMTAGAAVVWAEIWGR